MGFDDISECPQLGKLAHDYLKKAAGCEDNIFAFFANGPGPESLYVQLVEELDSDLEVDYGSELHASIVYAALAVDKELQPDKVKRQMSISDAKLLAHFEAVEARLLRPSFSSFVDLVTLATKTIEEFETGKASLIT